ncbi:hypothetical protein RJT34_11328 [Clitoria ternatea]|uniref:Uncharacterized protein n=1 Tax=Clitoria ternatea TaxID=43366 RepID=A0AAN9PJZ4_CLITE
MIMACMMCVILAIASYIYACDSLILVWCEKLDENVHHVVYDDIILRFCFIENHKDMEEQGYMRNREKNYKCDSNVEKKTSNVEPMLRKDKMRSGEPKGVGKKTQDSYYPKPEIKFLNHHKRDKLEAFKNMSKHIELENAAIVSNQMNMNFISGITCKVNKMELLHMWRT